MEQDRSWMTEFVNGVEEFISIAFHQPRYVSGNKIRCSCSRCMNSKFLTADKVQEHISRKLYAKMVMDALHPNFQSSVWNENKGEIHKDPNLSTAMFFSLLNDADSALWSGCTKHTKLSTMSQLLNVKSEF
ncbi:Transposase-associated domain - like 3 [Theobroma cacao]|nr:Transposase-associated domain - like 3 [Theobroma cacao]